MPSKAVFLSFASHDAEAARHVAEAHRASGVEVWFDQSELRGADAWDLKIHQQVHDCALFLPIISANTPSRPKASIGVQLIGGVILNFIWGR